MQLPTHNVHETGLRYPLSLSHSSGYVSQKNMFLKVIYHPLYGMNNYVFIWGHMIANHPIYGVIVYHVTLPEGHMIAKHPI